MLSPAPSRMEAASRGPSFHLSILASSCFYTRSLGHLLQHNPAIMTSQVARHLSAGTGEELSGEAGRLVGLGAGGLLCLMAAAHRLCVRREGIRIFRYHMLLQCSKRLATPESHTKYRLPISMDLKMVQSVQRRWLAQHRGSVAWVLRGTPPLLLSLPSIFKWPHMFASSRPATNAHTSVALGSFEGLCRGMWHQKAAVGNSRAFSCTLGSIHSSVSLSIRCIKRSMAAKSKIKCYSSWRAGKQAVFSEKSMSACV